MILNDEYQYIGRSSGVRAYGQSFYYYILLYAKTEGDYTTGKHKVSVLMRMATHGADATFYGYATTGGVTVGGESVISWTADDVPGVDWRNSDPLTEDGIDYLRHTDLAEGSVVIDTAYAERDIDITAAWQRLSISTTPPSWLPSTTKATADITVTLPALAEPELPDVQPTVVLPGVRVFADGVKVYDSLLEDYDLVGLKATTGVNVGGTAEIVMPVGHPAYSSFISHRTVVDIFRDGARRFRGRALYHADNFVGQRTVTCEGELCFLRDSVNRPYNYKNSTPGRVFRQLIGAHNEQVDDFKKFTIGEVTLPDEDITMNSDSAETVLDTLNKMLDRCGGYIVFTDAADGTRVINWLADINSRSGQVIEFGENLLDFSSTGANTKDLATGLIPYGAKNTKTKKRLTIESVNDGKDYIIAEDAQAVRGTIMTTVAWDDITDAAALLKKAKAYLDDSKVFITSLELTALDLSYLDKRIDALTVGDFIRVRSLPHGVDEDFQLSKMTEDFLRPDKSKITLGKDIQSLTRADVAGDNRTHNEIQNAVTQLPSSGEVDTEAIQESVMQRVAQVYAPQQALSEEATARKALIDLESGALILGGAAYPLNVYSSANIQFHKGATFAGSSVDFGNNQGIRMATKDGSMYYVFRVDTSNNCFVGNDYVNVYLRAKDAVYLHKTGAVVTSDQREKDSIEELPEPYMAMLDKLTPRRFRYKGRGDRYHVGFVAQEVEQAMTEAGLSAEDFGGFVDLNGDGSALGLAYDEFIGLLLHKIRRLEQKIETMEEKT